MKTLLFILILLGFTSYSYAQNYQLISPTTTRHFKPGTLKTFYSIRIDSMTTVGSNNYYYNHKILQQASNAAYPCEFTHTDSSWIGHRIIQQNNGDYIFFNKQSDSIHISPNTSLGNSWQLYEFSNGDYIEATVNSIGTQSILGTNDSIKTVELQVKNNMNVAVAHPINGETIVLSKNNGLVQIFNMWEFPNNLTPYILVGDENATTGIISLTDFDVYDYNIGDKFHFYNNYYIYGGIAPLSLSKEILEVLNKTISANQDSIIYEIKRCVQTQSNFLSGEPDTVYTYDTIQQVITNTEQFNYLTNEMLKDSSSYSLFNEIAYATPKRSFSKIGGYYYNSPSNCWESYIGTPPSNPYWVEGLGGPFYNSSLHTKALLYYKKGSETWGNPINCNTFTNIDQVYPNDHTIKIFPNPFLESATIQIKAFNAFDNWTFNLVDITGKTVRSISILQEKFTLEKANLSTGVYFYQLTNTAQRKQYTGKIILQ